MKALSQIALFLLLILMICCPANCGAQVGIGTTTPDTNSMFQVVNPDGLTTPIIFEGLPNTPSNNIVLTWDQVSGAVGWRIMPSSTGGLFISVINISEWRNAPLDIPVTTTTYLDDDIDLSLTRTITVAPNTVQVISIDYALPGGLVSGTGTTTTTIGAYIKKDGVKMQYSESSFSVRWIGDHQIASKSMPDWITNNTSSPMTVTYELRGYLNQEYIPPGGYVEYRLKRFDTDILLNKNWGTAEMYIRILVAD